MDQAATFVLILVFHIIILASKTQLGTKKKKSSYINPPEDPREINYAISYIICNKLKTT